VLAHQTGLPVSTMHRLLVDLTIGPIVEWADTGEYRPCPGWRRFAAEATTPCLRAAAEHDLIEHHVEIGRCHYTCCMPYPQRARS
jgi:DNA-binding IclR family transcriptional regulator